MKSLVRVYLVFVITLLVAVSGPDALIAQSPSVPFLVHNGGAVSETTSGTSAALADSLPLGGEGQSQSTFSPPGLRVQAGESIATEIGLSPSQCSQCVLRLGCLRFEVHERGEQRRFAACLTPGRTGTPRDLPAGVPVPVRHPHRDGLATGRLRERGGQRLLQIAAFP
jgi:hypothetical protein